MKILKLILIGTMLLTTQAALANQDVKCVINTANQGESFHFTFKAGGSDVEVIYGYTGATGDAYFLTQTYVAADGTTYFRDDRGYALIKNDLSFTVSKLTFYSAGWVNGKWVASNAITNAICVAGSTTSVGTQ